MLTLLGRLYGKIADIRNGLFDRGVFASHSLGARTISVGNITVGGTGKTPLVALVAEILTEHGQKVCVLTRGYGRKDPKKRVLVSDGKSVLADAATGGDEPVELAMKLLGKAVVVADADRVAAAEWSKEEFGVTAFVLDDGFQHRRAKRDLDIVCIDATNPFGNGRMLPAGILREPLLSLKRADVIVVTRTDLAENVEETSAVIRTFNPECPLFIAESSIFDIVELRKFSTKMHPEESNWDREEWAAKPVRGTVFAFCGLGNPDNFFERLRKEGFELAAQHGFADHHLYTQEEILGLERKANECAAKILLTTAKDAVKLNGLKFELPCFVVEIKAVINDESAFRELLQENL